jgi:hypothetical protein
VVRHGAASPCPPRCEGAWVSEEAQFNGELLVEGEAIYVGRDGFVAEFIAPPLSSRSGRARFDERTNELVCDLSRSGQSPEVVTMTVAVDRKRRKVVMESSERLKGPYIHRLSHIPKWVLEAAR